MAFFQSPYKSSPASVNWSLGRRVDGCSYMRGGSHECFGFCLRSSPLANSISNFRTSSMTARRLHYISNTRAGRRMKFNAGFYPLNIYLIRGRCE